jgi:hypothetical protein
MQENKDKDRGTSTNQNAGHKGEQPLPVLLLDPHSLQPLLTLLSAHNSSIHTHDKIERGSRQQEMLPILLHS